MAVFPDIPYCNVRSQAMSGVRWQRSVSGKDWGSNPWAGKTKRGWKLEFKILTHDEEHLLRTFYESNADSVFYFFEFDRRRVHSGESVLETAGGGLLTFTLPGKSISQAKVYVEGVEQEDGWSLSPESGANGEDQIIFTVAPADPVTADFTGRKRFLARFEGLLDDRQQFYPGLTIELVEVF